MRGRRKDPLRIIEAIYSFDGDEKAWTRGIAEAARPYDLGRGMWVAVAALGETPGVRSLAGIDVPWTEVQAASTPEIMGHALFRRAWAPRPFGWGAESLPRYCADAGISVAELV